MVPFHRPTWPSPTSLSTPRGASSQHLLWLTSFFRGLGWPSASRAAMSSYLIHTPITAAHCMFPQRRCLWHAHTTPRQLPLASTITGFLWQQSKHMYVLRFVQEVKWRGKIAACTVCGKWQCDRGKQRSKLPTSRTAGVQSCTGSWRLGLIQGCLGWGSHR